MKKSKLSFVLGVLCVTGLVFSVGGAGAQKSEGRQCHRKCTEAYEKCASNPPPGPGGGVKICSQYVRNCRAECKYGAKARTYVDAFMGFN